MKHTTARITAATALLLVTGTVSMPTQAATAASELTARGGQVTYHATYTGKIDGLRGNRHDVSLSSNGKVGHVKSSFCDSGGDCVERSHRRISSQSPLTFRVSPSGRSAVVTGNAQTRTAAGWSPRTFVVDLKLYSVEKAVDGRRAVNTVSGHFGWNEAASFVTGHITRD